MTLEECGDLAESLVPLAAELAFLVRTEGRDTIGAWLDKHGAAEGEPVTAAIRALLVVLAAMVDVDATGDQLLSWVTWDERGVPLDGTIPLLPAVPVPDLDPPLRKPADRRREFARLVGRGFTVEEAAVELGVHVMTARRYEAAMKQEAGRAA